VTFFLLLSQDGIEQNNVISGNLGALTRKSFSLLQTDTTPATFWVTNPNNYFISNTAAGSEGYGFWSVSRTRNFSSFLLEVFLDQFPGLASCGRLIRRPLLVGFVRERGAFLMIAIASPLI
jgi:hypothetical protein